MGEVPSTTKSCFSWFSSRDMESRMQDLNWTQVKNVAKEISYALHLVHKTSKGCPVDLKPLNIMFEEVMTQQQQQKHTQCIPTKWGLRRNDRIILRDFGLFHVSGDAVPCTTGVILTMIGVPLPNKRDVLGYGVILIQLLMDQAGFWDQFNMVSGPNLRASIDEYVDQGGDLGNFIKWRLLEEARDEEEAEIPKKQLNIAKGHVAFSQQVPAQ
ncbi:hypothetical protein FXO37_13585 [Capsicum annuum]|nr:hypothetical protein FXO37_13585 [Capsicum annuum]